MAGEEIVRLVPLEEGEPWPFHSVPWEEDIDEMPAPNPAVRVDHGLHDAARGRNQSGRTLNTQRPTLNAQARHQERKPARKTRFGRIPADGLTAES
jgi:hypothetical protein